MTIMLRKEMIPMMMGSTPMHTMQLILLLFDDHLTLFESSNLYFFPFLFLLLCVCMDYGYGVMECMWNMDIWLCYFFPFLDDELMTEFENFECWITFSYFYYVHEVYGVRTTVWSMD
ncbi:hypothetical protein AMTRI_Chr10g229830 [Amborella trichopoda]